MTTRQSKIFYGWGVAILVFLSATVSLLALNNRISIDDMFFIARIRQNGITAMVAEQYNQYSGRYGAYSLNGLLLSTENHVLLAVWNVLSISVFTLSLHWLLKSFTHSVSRTSILFLAVALLAGCVHTGEEFFWYTQVNTYLWSATCIIFITGFLLRKHNNGIYTWIAFAAAAFAGSGAESFLVSVMPLWICILFARRHSIDKKRIRVQLSVLPVAIACLLPSLMAPGNGLRLETLQQEHDSGFFYVLLQTLYHYFADFKTVTRWLFLLPAAIAAGLLCPAQKSPFSLPVLTGSYLLLFLCFISPAAWTLGEPPPPRAMLLCDVLTVLFLFLLVQKVAGNFRLHTAIGYALGSAVGVLAFIPMLSSSFAYARAYDAREKLIRQECPCTSISVQLPQCAAVKPANARCDSADYTFRHIALYYNCVACE